MTERTRLRLTRDCDAIAIPSGRIIRLTEGTEVGIVQSLGGHYTVEADGATARIDGADADALGLIAAGPRCGSGPVTIAERR
ncbi:hypothetical protein [Marinobacterium aestuariivivens]|uniref:DUF2171 domain-containing protein n=1 Tax=Marinobacterium aestuariivivens TaxID=1698799 RepID=A0ABW2A780_9GAMM